MTAEVRADARLFSNGGRVSLTVGPSTIALYPSAARELAAILMCRANQSEALERLAGDPDHSALLFMLCEVCA